jgi:hypothetical protein
MLKIPIIKITLSKNQNSFDVSNYINPDGENSLNTQIVKHVQSALAGKNTSQYLCQFEDEHGAAYNVTLDEKSWKKALNKSNEYFLKKEQYEICKTIKELLTKI